MQMGIDVGYGQVKGVSEKGKKVIFPSLVAPLTKGPLENDMKHKVFIQCSSVSMRESAVGDGARYSKLIQQLSGQEKPTEAHDILLLTAIALLAEDTKEPISLGVGLPLAYYAAQKDQLKQRLSCMAGKVSVDGSLQHQVSFSRVEVFPQGTGAIAASGIDYSSSGRIGLIDIGTYTTDFVLLEIENGRKSFIPDGCGSREIGAYQLFESLDKAFQAKAGMPLPIREYSRTLDNALQQKPLCFDGKEIHLHKTLEYAMEELTDSVMSQVRAVWGDWARFLDYTILAGGGSVVLHDRLKNKLSNPVMAKDPVFANAWGYLEYVKAS
ncbi:MAG: ParM/StbA family protein [Syntrophomonadaceae bacterium]|jgi:plasmid segregation protein ParM|nr:ParM/StbA family protein [Syntrophomonadaceae bacterium]